MSAAWKQLERRKAPANASGRGVTAKLAGGQEKQQRRVSPPGALDLCEWPYLIIGVFKFPVAAAETAADV